MTFLLSWSTSKAQVGGNDYIIMLDNGASTTDQGFIDMKRGAVKLIEQLIACNRRNRVAVVHYGAGKYNDTSGIYTPIIYIESDFIGDQFIAQNFDRRLDFGDHLNEALGLVSNALDGTWNGDIISTQTTLSNSQPLKVVVFTDAERNTGALDGSYLVNYLNTTLNAPAAFKNVLAFKIDRQAQFTMIHANTNTSAVQAAASIASSGGSYMGSLETNVDDPDYGIWPRQYYNRPIGFGMLSSEMEYWKDMAGTICNSSGWGTVNFRYEPGECISHASGIGGTYNLPPGATLVHLRLEIGNIATGDIHPIPFNPTIVGNSFNTGLQPSDFDYAVNAGATGKYKFRIIMVYNYGGVTYNTYSWNNYPYFDYDIDMDCTLKTAPKEITKETIVKLTPNPTEGVFKVMLDSEIQSGQMEIKDLNGNTVFSKAIRKTKEIEADIIRQLQGVYLIRITSGNNEIYSGKIIKK